MAWTQAELDSLEEAIAKGYLRVQYQDRVVWYRTLDEMLQIRNEMRKALGQVKKGDRFFVKTAKGICNE